MSSIATIPEGYQAVTPWVIVRGVPAFIDFLATVFDATETVRLLGDDGVRVVHAEVRIDGAPVMMFDAAGDWPPTPAFLRVYVADCADVLRRATAAGGRTVTEPTDMFFGERIARFRDPWGNLWWVHMRLPSTDVLPDVTTPQGAEAMTYVAETLEAEMQRRGGESPASGNAGESGQHLLDVLLDAWDRNQAILLNLLGAIPAGGLDARAHAGSPTVSEMFTHMHHERMVSVLENAPEHAGQLPEREWNPEGDASRIAQMLHESGKRVRDAVEGRVKAGRALERDYEHPIHLFHLLIFHEGYHHGQIKLALKAAGCGIPDADAGPLTWNVWRTRTVA